MAKPKMVKCRVCGHEVSDHAPACPQCGDEVAKRFGNVRKPSGCGTLLAVLLAVFAIVFMIDQCSSTPSTDTAALKSPSAPSPPSEDIKQAWQEGMNDDSMPTPTRIGYANSIISNMPGTPEADTAREMLVELKAKLAEENIGRQWSYSRSEDPMTGGATRRASVQSTNTHEFDFPYARPQRATLELRRHPRWGDDVIFRIERGQLICRSYGECPVRVRFDDGSPRTLKGNPPSDHSSETIFIPGYNDFSGRLSKAKRVRIEVNVYQQGAPVWEFDVEGFDGSNMK